MSFLKTHYTNIVRPDLLLTDVPCSVFTLPRPAKVVLMLKSSDNTELDILHSLIILELIGDQKPCFWRSVSAGNIRGSSVTLRNKMMYNFLCRLLLQVLPKVKQFQGLNYPAHPAVYSFTLDEVLLFEGVPHLLNQGDTPIKGLHCDFHFNATGPSDIARVGRSLAICFQEAP